MTPIHKNVWLWAFLVGIVLVTLMRPLLRRIPEAPPVLGQLPPFVLVDPDGERLDLDRLEGNVWVVAFFAIGDDSVCAGLIESMTELGQRYDEAGVAEVLLLGIGSGTPVAPSATSGDASATSGDGLATSGDASATSGDASATSGDGLASDSLDGTLDPSEDALGQVSGRAQDALREFGEKLGLVPPRWSLATGDPDEIARLGGALVEATGEGAGSRGFQGGVPHRCRLYLVDGSGGIRGAYPDDTKGLDEVFHRAQHVARAPGL